MLLTSGCYSISLGLTARGQARRVSSGFIDLSFGLSAEILIILLVYCPVVSRWVHQQHRHNTFCNEENRHGY